MAQHFWRLKQNLTTSSGDYQKLIDSVKEDR